MAFGERGLIALKPKLLTAYPVSTGPFLLPGTTPEFIWNSNESS